MLWVKSYGAVRPRIGVTIRGRCFVYRMVSHSGFYWSKRWWCGSGISWTICKSFAPRSRQWSV